jgi:tetratricopeptide (TPR) repeat protein
MRSEQVRELEDLQAEEADLRSRGDYAGAFRVLDRMLAINPSFSPALNNKGGILLSLDRFDDAMPFFERATAADPTNGVAWNNLGLCLHILRRSEEALEKFRTARDVGYGHEGVLYNAGIAHLGLGDLAAGVESWRASLSVNPFQASLVDDLGKLARAFGVDPDPDPDVVAQELARSVVRFRVDEVIRSRGSRHFFLRITGGGRTTLLGIG